MGLLLLQIVPVAVGIAVNPVPIIAALIMAGTRRPVVNGSALVGVPVLVMALFGGVVLVLVPTSTIGGRHGPSTPHFCRQPRQRWPRLWFHSRTSGCMVLPTRSGWVRSSMVSHPLPLPESSQRSSSNRGRRLP